MQLFEPGQAFALVPPNAVLNFKNEQQEPPRRQSTVVQLVGATLDVDGTTTTLQLDVTLRGFETVDAELGATQLPETMAQVSVLIDDVTGTTTGTTGTTYEKTNTASGSGSLASNTTGVDNTAMGFSALTSNTTGIDNTALGAVSLLSNTTGDRNTALGFGSLVSNTTGNHNTAVGNDAAQKCTSGTFNTVIGSGADVNSSDAKNQIVIGAYQVGQGDNTAVIGGDSVHMNTIVLGCQSGISTASMEEDVAAQEDGPGVDGQIRLCNNQLQLHVENQWKTVLLQDTLENLEQTIQQIQSNIDTNTSNIGTNTSKIGTNTSNIGTNTSNIGTNTSNIGTNTSDIENNKEEITDLLNFVRT